MHHYYVYIMTSTLNDVLYIGVTNNLERRVMEHKDKAKESFTAKYNVTKLVYFEETSDVEAALNREKQVKHWNRTKKIILIERMNPKWEDLSLGWFS